MPADNLNRRNFLGAASLAGAMLPAAGSALAASNKSASQGRVIGANDKINVGVIGTGGRGFYVAERFASIGEKTGACQVVAVCDVWQRRVTEAKAKFKCDGTLDYREILARKDIDAVLVATPDHWHAKIALEAMDKGKDVYLEKPMCHTVEEARALVNTVKETGRIIQVGSQTTSGDQWWKARKAIADGMLGNLVMSQGSYHRNSTDGEWNWKIDQNAGPDKSGDDYIDWKMWLGSASKRPYDADRYFRFRKYWDYSGGIATDLFYHVMAPMNICWGEAQFPQKVIGSGGIYVFKDEREVPDTFQLVAEYKNFALVLSSSMANSQHIPGLIRGHLGTLIMVEHGRFEGFAPVITVKPEARVVNAEYKAKWGTADIKIPVEDKDTLIAHITNFLDCIRSRQKPTLDVETGARAQVAITLGVRSYREGKVLYFDEKNWKVVDKPVKA